MKFGIVRSSIYRVISSYSSQRIDSTIPVPTLANDPTSPDIRQLRQTLEEPQGFVVVATTADQTFRLVTRGDDHASPIAELFDFIIIDEASQMDVGKSLPLVCAAAATAQVVVAGDPMQLDPIFTTPPPLGAEYLLGSVYTYLKQRFDLNPSNGLEQTLEVNYRSNEAIVAYGRALGYPAAYRSNSPSLRLDLGMYPPLPAPDWPDSLVWTPDWVRFLDPAVPIMCFSYSEGRSGQSNRFESQAVAALLWLLFRARPRRPLLGERGGTPGPSEEYNPQAFWEQGVGVVTPHSAQRAMIIENLRRAFQADGDVIARIRRAVNTVERFQGQQRDVIVASFAVGDPDVVAQEEEFLLTLNRFNVMASRARAKLIVLVTDEILDHLPNDDKVLAGSRAIKLFAGSFCQDPQPLTLPWRDRDGVARICEGTLRTYPGSTQAGGGPARPPVL